MNGLYIGSTDGSAGKTLLALALGQRFQRQGRRIGFIKPVDALPAVPGDPDGLDSRFVREALGLSDPLSHMAPVVLPRQCAKGVFPDAPADRLPEIVDAYRTLAADKDAMLIGGLGDFLHAGGGWGLAGPRVARALGARVLLLDRVRREPHVERLLPARELLGERLVGVIFNDVPEAARDEVEGLVAPFLARRGLPVLGCVGHDPFLAGIRVGELARGLGCRVVSGPAGWDRLVGGCCIGAMQAENFLSRFRRRQDAAVLCGGDRIDVQLLALEAGCAALLLTGDIVPDELVLAKAADRDIALLLLRQDTFAAAGAVRTVMARAKFRDPARIAHGARLVERALRPAGDNHNLAGAWRVA